MTNRGREGFTLIEILVVIIIISIVTGVALLSLSRNENRKLKALTDELVQRLTLAEEQALLLPAVLGFRLESDSYRFMRYQTAMGKKASWVPIPNVAAISLPDDVQLFFDQPSSSEVNLLAQAVPQIIISSNGEMTIFTLYVGRKGKPPRYVIKGEADGHLSSQSLS